MKLNANPFVVPLTYSEFAANAWVPRNRSHATACATLIVSCPSVKGPTTTTGDSLPRLIPKRRLSGLALIPSVPVGPHGGRAPWQYEVVAEVLARLVGAASPSLYVGQEPCAAHAPVGARLGWQQ